MEKIFNNVSIAIALLGGIMSGYLGGVDILIEGLIFFVGLDYLTGILKAIYNKKLSSEIGFKGIFKKIFIFVIVAMAVQVDVITGAVIPLRDITVLFYISNESISLLENAAEFLPIPENIKDVLLQLRNKKETKNNK
ncbi:MAG: phage holin family protein [Oscillospiraceae bacterium]